MTEQRSKPTELPLDPLEVASLMPPAEPSREPNNVYALFGAEMPKVPGASLAELERWAILRTMRETGSTAKTAEILGISQRKVQYKINEYRADFRAHATRGKRRKVRKAVAAQARADAAKEGPKP